MVRGRHENHIQLLPILGEELTPIGVSRRLFPAFLFQHPLPAALIGLGKGDTLQPILMAKGGVVIRLPADSNKPDLQFLIQALAADNSRKTQGGSGPNRSDTLNELATRK